MLSSPLLDSPVINTLAIQADYAWVTEEREQECYHAKPLSRRRYFRFGGTFGVLHALGALELLPGIEPPVGAGSICIAPKRGQFCSSTGVQ